MPFYTGDTEQEARKENLLFQQRIESVICPTA
jgi:hypothetical protein